MKKIFVRNHLSAHPANFTRDWKILVLSFAIGMILLSLFAWQIYLSDHIGGGYLSIETSLPDTTPKTISLGRLRTSLATLKTRQADWQKNKANTSQMIDPSL